MDYAINLATAADSWKVVKRAEELGFARAWFFDTQLLNADVFVAMAAAAMQTCAQTHQARAEEIRAAIADGDAAAAVVPREAMWDALYPLLKSIAPLEAGELERAGLLVVAAAGLRVLSAGWW